MVWKDEKSVGFRNKLVCVKIIIDPNYIILIN